MKLYIKPKFIAPILDGTCIHLIGNLIGVDNEAYFKKGAKIELYKQLSSGELNDERFATKYCMATQNIVFKWGQFGKNKIWKFQVLIDGYEILPDSSMMAALIQNAGFTDFLDFSQYKLWFHKRYSAKIIHFTDFLYKPAAAGFKKPTDDNTEPAQHIPSLIYSNNFDVLIELALSNTSDFNTRYYALTNSDKVSFYRYVKNECNENDMAKIVDAIINQPQA